MPNAETPPPPTSGVTVVVPQPVPPPGQPERRGPASAVQILVDKGLTGIWQLVGQATAMTVVCVVFLWVIGDWMKQAKEDRQLFREEQRVQRDQDERRFDRMQANTDRRVEVMARSLDAAVAEMRRAVDVIDRRVKPLKDNGPQSRLETAPAPKPAGG